MTDKNPKGYKGQMKTPWIYNKTVSICGIYSSLEEAFDSVKRISIIGFTLGFTWMGTRHHSNISTDLTTFNAEGKKVNWIFSING